MKRTMTHLLLACCLLTVAQAEPRAASSKPNILFIFADDLSFEAIGAAERTGVQTPNLDRLAQRGTLFTHTYNMGGWHGAICVASRTMLNTGRSLWRARALEAMLDQEIEAGRMWSQLIGGGGYQTYMTGKWHVRADTTKIFDHVVHERPGMPNQTPEGYERPVEGKPDVWSPADPAFGGFWKGGKHWSEVLAEDAERFLAQAAQSSKPFFMYLAFNAPHDPRQAPKEFQERYPYDRIQLPENFLSEYPHMEGMGAGRDLRDEQLAPWPRTPRAVQVHRSEYYAIITHMDVQIGRILDALEASSRAENTYIIFTADHGLAVGHHGLIGKQNMYEHSLRVPMILVGPEIPRGRQVSIPVYVQDVMPTTLELAGVPIPEHVEFKSLLPLLRGERSQQYPAIYGAYREDRQRAVIANDFKLIHYPAVDVYRLFDLKNDPLEQNDLVGDVAQATKLEEMKRLLRTMQREMGDPLGKK